MATKWNSQYPDFKNCLIIALDDRPVIVMLWHRCEKVKIIGKTARYPMSRRPCWWPETVTRGADAVASAVGGKSPARSRTSRRQIVAATCRPKCRVAMLISGLPPSRKRSRACLVEHLRHAPTFSLEGECHNHWMGTRTSGPPGASKLPHKKLMYIHPRKTENYNHRPHKQDYAIKKHLQACP